LDYTEYQLRNPFEVILHIISWFFAFYFFEVILARCFDNLLYYLKDEFHLYLILGFISSYQMTKGKLEGIANTHKKWKNWIQTQENQTIVK